MSRIIDANTDVLFLGKTGENLATTVRFHVSAWIADHGVGTFQLLVKRNGDVYPYPASIALAEEAYVLWDVTESDVAYPGYGKCELNYYVNNVLAKSWTWGTKVVQALDDTEQEVPEPYESWVQSVLAAGSAAQSSAIDAEDSAERAETAADRAEDARDAAIEASEAAAISASNAQTYEAQSAINAQAAEYAARTMSYATFTMDEFGHVIIINSERLGTTSFQLNEEGHLEVILNG